MREIGGISVVSDEPEAAACRGRPGRVSTLALVGLLSVLCSPRLAAADELDSEACLACHGEEGFAPAGRALYTDPALFRASAHGSLPCTICHTDVTELPHTEHLHSVRVETACAACHEDAVLAYQRSVHGRTNAEGAPEAAACADCHGAIHALKPHTDPGSSRTGRSSPPPAGAAMAPSSRRASFISLSFARSRRTWRACTRGGCGGRAGCGLLRLSRRAPDSRRGRTPTRRRREPASRPRAESATRKCWPTTGRACTVWRSRADIATSRCAPIATASTAFWHRASRTRRCSQPTFRVKPAAAVTASTAEQEVRPDAGNTSPPSMTAITGSRCAPGSCAPPTAPAATGYTTSALQRSAFTRPPGEPADDLWQMPPGCGRTFALGPVHVLPATTSARVVSWVRFVYLWLIGCDGRRDGDAQCARPGAQGAGRQPPPPSAVARYNPNA